MQMWRKFFTIVIALLLVIPVMVPTTTQASASEKQQAINWAIANKYMSQTAINSSIVREKTLLDILAKLDEHYVLTNRAPETVYTFYDQFHIPLKGLNRSDSAVTRGDYARIYAAFKGHDVTEKHAVQYLYTEGITTGATGNKTYASYKPTVNLSGSDLAVFLYRSVQKETFGVIGLQAPATGKHDANFNLPPGFLGEGEVELPKPEPEPGNDIVGSDSSKSVVQEVVIEKQDLIANGVDSTAIRVKLQNCSNQPIANDVVHQFQVRSNYGAYAIDNEGKVTRNVYTDGDTIYATIVAPQLTKSVRDTISLELVNNKDSSMSCFVGKRIEIPLRYAPKAEMRVTYDVWDPDQPEDDNTNIKPPAIITEQSPEFFQEGLIDVYNIFEGYTFEIGQLTEYRDLLGEIKKEYIHYGKDNNANKDALGYGNAVLKFEDYDIALWLFDRMLQERVYEGAVYPAQIQFSRVDPLRPTYTIQGIDDVIAAQAEHINAVAAIVQLMSYLPDEKDITLEHYDSVMSIWAIYENLGQKERDVFLRYEKGKKLGQLEAYKKRVDALKESDISANRPKEYERYTKVMVNLYMPGGDVITDYQGEVEITFNGEKRKAHFITNTSSSISGTGEPGTAVAYFDSIVYGESEGTVEISVGDKEYDKMLKDLMGKPQTFTVYTDPKFENNSCSRATELAVVVDYSESMKIADPDNDRAKYVRKMVKQFNSEHNIIVRADTQGVVLKEGKAKDVLTHSLFDNAIEKGGTDLLKATDVALNRFTDNKQAGKALVIVSDGKTSTKLQKQIITKAKAQGVKVYTIGLGDEKQLNNKTLVALARDTGGTYFHVTNRMQFHNSMQVLINAVLCNKTLDACSIGSELLQEPKVTMRRNHVTMSTRVDNTCGIVDKVVVNYRAAGGDLQFQLGNRSNTLFTTTVDKAAFQDLNLNKNVEFIAYDKDGNVVSRKNVTVQ
ncbi:hypothetical protein GCM10007425_22780 [Lysinibacillus alkalisoli]|uniref:VWFA domain-containing protein n=1 Tax=Lysinibacillus alkalisoli TaxID=1911548 RepID=A0A917G8J6_9BACI|nr:VWA domain-containing protein [Lysinibacillus alkalisoli]GGG27665.1 hypothetical protein GCM10007425_22780 [Lysinibacillus alkalisoli]